MYQVYVQANDGTPLMPTTRFRKVKHLLREGMAKVVYAKPFTIRLLYDSTRFVQPLYGGTDGGRTNIGNAVVTKNGKAIYGDHVTTCNKEVKKHMEERKRHRAASRRGERLRRKRRAKKNKTTTHKYDGVGRKLPRCKKPTMMKDIKNTEAKFANRTREEGWLTPTATQLVRTILNQVDKVCKLLPVKDWTIELNKFSFMQLEDGSIRGVDYQNGRLKGFKDAYAYVDYQQNGICAFCKKPIVEHHHIIPKCEGGSDGPENLIGLCLKHHKKIQNGEMDSEKLRGKKKKYAGTSVWNQAMPFVYKKLVERFGEKHVFLTTGWETKETRYICKIEKTHCNDAICIAANGIKRLPYIPEDVIPFEVEQFRNHDRANIDNQKSRVYQESYIDEKGKEKWRTVATNRKKAMNQKTPSLKEWFEQKVEEVGIKEARRLRSILRVKPSKRSYANRNRILPGAIVIHEGERKVLSGQQNNGDRYLLNHSKKSVDSKTVKIVIHNDGLVYM